MITAAVMKAGRMTGIRLLSSPGSFELRHKSCPELIHSFDLVGSAVVEFCSVFLVPADRLACCPYMIPEVSSFLTSRKQRIHQTMEAYRREKTEIFSHSKRMQASSPADISDKYRDRDRYEYRSLPANRPPRLFRLRPWNN